jgi:nicotinamidase-related amidase
MMDELPLPDHYNPETVAGVWRVPYQDRASQAKAWAKKHDIRPASEDDFKIMLMLVDVQNTFCIPGFELFVGGRSGTAAVDDNQRLCQFIYRNMHRITQICPTLDSHQAMQIFHGIFLINDQGEHPPPYTLMSVKDIETGAWRFNPKIAESLGIDAGYGQEYLQHYVKRLKQGGKYDLTIWPYHAMLGSIGHALVPAVEEAVFSHGIARYSRPDFQLKGNHALTENYSVLGAEVLDGPDGRQVAQKNDRLMKKLTRYDAVIIAGQAKSHCVAWTVEDILNENNRLDKELCRKIYLLEDCTSPVVIPGGIDYTDPAREAFQRFADAGMHIVKSTDSMSAWRGMDRVRNGCSTVDC